MRLFSSLRLAVTAAALAVSVHAAIEVNEGKLQSMSSAGITESTITFPPAGASSKILSLSSTSTLTLSFTSPGFESLGYAALILSVLSPRSLPNALAASTNGSLAAADPDDGGQGELFRRAQAQVGSVSIYLSPKKGGRYKWEWDLAASRREDILALARKGDGRVKASLLLSPLTRGGREEPLYLELGTVLFADEDYWKKPRKIRWPREWEMDRYSARYELAWTFRQPHKAVGSFKTLIGLVIVFAPWGLLAILASQLLPSLSLSLPASSIPFLATLGLLEASIVAYWLGAINAWRLMPLAGILGLATLLSGKNALGRRLQERERRQNRVQASSK